MRISPLDPGLAGLIAGTALAHVVCGDYEQALEAANKAILESPEFATGHRLRTMALGGLGRIDEARLTARRLLELTPEFTVSRFESVSALRDPETRRRIANTYRAAGIPN
jgi:tetratricopeptide (TPR) repeat protein